MKALVLGASGGIGSEVLKALTAAGHEVVGQKFNRPIQGLRRVDLNHENQLHDLVASAELDILVHAAGVNVDGMSWKLSAVDFDEVMAVNARSAWLAAKYAIPKMRERGFGRIIFISSVLGKVGVPGTLAYTASKGALEAMARVMAAELVGKGITVNVIAPGYLNCGIGVMPSEIKAKCEARIPMGRFGEARDVARTVLWLVESDYVTGEVVRVDGGM